MKFAIKGLILVAMVVGLVLYGMYTVQTLAEIGQNIGK